MQKKIHIGVIPDGNRRWCKKNNSDVFKSIDIMKNAIIQNFEDREELKETYTNFSLINEATIYILSKDNLLKRKDDTIKMVEYALEVVLSNLNNIKKYLKIQFIGELELLPENILEMVKKIQDETTEGSFVTTVGIAYDPILDSFKLLNNSSERGKFEQSDIDLVIRTGGEIRTSGFFPLKTLYSEFIFLDNLFPDLTLLKISDSIDEYLKRERRFGQ